MSAAAGTAESRLAGDIERVLLIGGTSEIGLAIVRKLVQAARAGAPVATAGTGSLAVGPRVYLLGRDRERLGAALAELERAGCPGGWVDVVDANDSTGHQAAIEHAFETSGGFDVVVLAVGVLGGQQGLDAGAEEALEVMGVNFLGSGSLLLHCLRRLRAQGRGTMIVLSSVAAERARASNPIYGAAKAGLDSLAQGLADSLAGAGVRVIVVRPGFVTTRMTAGLKPAPFATTPEAVAQATLAALHRDRSTIWVPAILRHVFFILRHLPRPLYRRLPL